MDGRGPRESILTFFFGSQLALNKNSILTWAKTRKKQGSDFLYHDVQARNISRPSFRDLYGEMGSEVHRIL